jgi:hypothetical protein
MKARREREETDNPKFCSEIFLDKIMKIIILSKDILNSSQMHYTIKKLSSLSYT